MTLNYGIRKNISKKLTNTDFILAIIATLYSPKFGTFAKSV